MLRVVVIALLGGMLFSPARAETLLERGDYLVNGIVACGNCHTPQGPDGPLAGMEFAGQLVIDWEPFTAYAPNITPDAETGIGGWSKEDVIRAIREGLRPDGSLIGPPMPIGLYRGISDEDVEAIAAYVLSVPAVSNEVPKSVYRIPLPPSYGPPVENVAAPAREDRLAYGAYLAGPLGHCVECHTPFVEGHADLENQLGAGGNVLPGPWGISVSANITPHPRDGIDPEITDAQLAQMIRQGQRPDGAPMMPPMGYRYYASIDEADMAALIRYIRSLEPKPLPGN
ncbi:MAG: c-type cytochrome [Rhodovibrionaceae bacterium]